MLSRDLRIGANDCGGHRGASVYLLEKAPPRHTLQSRMQGRVKNSEERGGQTGALYLCINRRHVSSDSYQHCSAYYCTSKKNIKHRILTKYLVLKMVCLLGIMAVAAATIIGTNAFTQPCHFPYDQCGWVLASRDYGKYGPCSCLILDGA